MRKYHHIGIPKDEPRPGETYHPGLKIHTSGYGSNSFGIEWMRFDDDRPVSELVRRVPHVAFKVDDLQSELEGREVLIAPNSPSKGVTVAFIVEDGAPVELLQFG